MPKKWNLQDIRPSQPAEREPRPEVVSPRRTSMDIGPKRAEPVPVYEQPTYDPDLGRLDIVDGNATKKKRTIVVVVLAALVLGGAFFANVLMGGAQVTVHPKFKDVSVQATFTSYKEPKAGELGFELLTLEATGERQVKASGTEKVSERAVGNIFIYNTDTKSTQRLIKNTRFESPSGFIFRIQESVVVPSATTDAKGSLVPGVVTAKVFADGVGEQYNVGPSRFSVPGLKDTPQASTVYGESTVAMTGGFEGERYLLDEAELETKKQELHLELRNSLLERLKAERPSGFIVFDNAVTFTFESLPATSYGESLATIKEKAQLNVPLFEEGEFAKYLAESTIAGYEDEPVSIDPAPLSFQYSIATTSVSDISNHASLEFLLKGATRIIWEFDENKLKADLINLPDTGLSNVLSSYPAIDRAEAVVRPFWAQNFPDSEDKITVTTVLSEEKNTEKNGVKDN